MRLCPDNAPLGPQQGSRGLAPLVRHLQTSLPFTIGLAATLIPNAVLAHLVLAFPDGRLHSMLERLLVGSAYLSAAVLQIVMLMFMNISNVGGCPCPSNLLFVRDKMNLHATLMNQSDTPVSRLLRESRWSSPSAGDLLRHCSAARSHPSSSRAA